MHKHKKIKRKSALFYAIPLFSFSFVVQFCHFANLVVVLQKALAQHLTDIRYDDKCLWVDFHDQIL